MITSFLFQISKDYPELAKAEIEELCETTTEILSNDLLFCTGSESKLLTLSKRLGLTKVIYEIKKTYAETSLPSVINRIHEGDIENTYKITVVRTKETQPSTKEVADALYRSLPESLVDIHEPENHYVFFWLDDQVYFTEEVFVNTDTPHERRSHLKEHNHPTSIHPKLSKAMINLSGAKEFHDPFCGAGGILIEGGLMGLHVTGSDISKDMLKRAQENAQAFSLEFETEQQDALSLEGTYTAIVTDLPFGKNSLVTYEPDELAKRFIDHAQKLTKKLVIGIDSSQQLLGLTQGTKWKAAREFTIYVHKSLSRKILLLEQ